MSCMKRLVVDALLVQAPRLVFQPTVLKSPTSFTSSFACREVPSGGWPHPRVVALIGRHVEAHVRLHLQDPEGAPCRRSRHRGDLEDMWNQSLQRPTSMVSLRPPGTMESASLPARRRLREVPSVALRFPTADGRTFDDVSHRVAGAERDTLPPSSGRCLRGLRSLRQCENVPSLPRMIGLGRDHPWA